MQSGLPSKNTLAGAAHASHQRPPQAAGQLSFILGATAAVLGREVVSLRTPTPMGDGGSLLESVSEEIGALLAPGYLGMNKSTAPV